jgi:hypothetical protein
MTFLILLTTPTGAEIVTSNLLHVTLDLLGSRLSRDLSPVAGEHLALWSVLRLLNALCIFLSSNLYGKELLDDILLHALKQLLEHRKGFFLVLLQRIFLGISAQPNALLKMIHGEQMILPETVNCLE